MLRENKVKKDICVFECLCCMCLAWFCNIRTDSSNFALRPQANETEQKVVVVSVSPQSRASLAARYGLSSSEAGRRLTSFFKGLGE